MVYQTVSHHFSAILGCVSVNFAWYNDVFVIVSKVEDISDSEPSTCCCTPATDRLRKAISCSKVSAAESEHSYSCREFGTHRKSLANVRTIDIKNTRRIKVRFIGSCRNKRAPRSTPDAKATTLLLRWHDGFTGMGAVCLPWSCLRARRESLPEARSRTMGSGAAEWPSTSISYSVVLAIDLKSIPYQW